MKLMPRLILLSIILVLVVSASAFAVTISVERGIFTVTGKNYKATVDAGCITSLNVNGVELLNSSVSISRGFYLFTVGKPMLFADISKTSNSITAKSSIASYTATFSSKSMSINVKNTSIGNVAAFFVFDAKLEALRTDSDEYIKPPVEMAVNRITMFSGDAKVVMKGSDRIWGPWQKGTQVWEVVLKPNETKKINLDFDKPNKEEREEINKLSKIEEKVEEPLIVHSPKPYQVFQRSSLTEGSVLISGRVNLDFDRITVRISGRPLSGELHDKFQPVTCNKEARLFFSTLTLPAGGWYKFEFAAWKGTEVIAHATIENVGVGEVFVGAGQSNSTNCGETQLKCGSLMVSTFSGSDWRVANDPQPGCHDKSARGSFWPAFGDAMYEKYRVPIGVAVTGHTGTSVSAWQPGGDLFIWMTTRMHQLGKGGFRAVLWHQGERDVAMQSNEYAAKMVNLIAGSKAEVGWEFPWFVAKVSYHNPSAKTCDTTRSAQQWLWDNGHALEGPDTDTLDEPYREKDGKGIHFNEAGLKEHGKLWAAKVSVWLDEVLAK